MDILKHNFIAALPQILRAIAEGDMVSIDLEMSGIGDCIRRDVKKPTLQAHYDEIRKAAIKYTIVQMGITTTKADWARGVYEITGIYNINLDPLVSEANKIGIERDVTFSSGSMHFLQAQGFKLEASIRDGVTFISRAEQAKALANYDTRQQNFANPTRQLLDDISSYDHEAIAFVRSATSQIKFWINATANGMTTENCVNIDITSGTHARYHRKLIHELLRSQFTNYRAYQRHGATFITVEKIDPTREASVAAGRKTVFEAALKKETGFRWVIEALFGGDVTGIDPNWFAVSYDGNSQWIDINKIERDLSEIQDTIRFSNSKRLLVGHNLFMDLAFLYQTFIDDLPVRVEDFQAMIHQLLPNVIDTKFIATSVEHTGHLDSSSLAELSTKYKNVLEPVIDIPENFRAYITNPKLHEAGYDSWICAEACLRMISTMQKKSAAGIPAHPGSVCPKTGVQMWAKEDITAQFANEADLEDPAFKHMLSTLTCGQETPIGINPVPGGPYNLVNGQPRNTAFIFDISNDWYQKYMNKLRVFRCEEEVCDLASCPRPLNYLENQRPIVKLPGQSVGLNDNNLEYNTQHPQQPPAYFGEHPVHFAQQEYQGDVQYPYWTPAQMRGGGYDRSQNFRGHSYRGPGRYSGARKADMGNQGI